MAVREDAGSEHYAVLSVKTDGVTRRSRLLFNLKIDTCEFPSFVRLESEPVSAGALERWSIGGELLPQCPHAPFPQGSAFPAWTRFWEYVGS